MRPLSCDAVALLSGGSMGLAARPYQDVPGPAVAWAGRELLALPRAPELLVSVLRARGRRGQVVRVRGLWTRDRGGGPLSLAQRVHGGSAELLLLALALRTLEVPVTGPLLLTGSGSLGPEGVVGPVESWAPKLEALRAVLRSSSAALPEHIPVVLLHPASQADEVCRLLGLEPGSTELVLEGHVVRLAACAHIDELPAVLGLVDPSPSPRLLGPRLALGGSVVLGALLLGAAVLPELSDGAESSATGAPELRLLWTGRPEEPGLHEVLALGDLDGDGTEDLGLVSLTAGQARGAVELRYGALSGSGSWVGSERPVRLRAVDGGDLGKDALVPLGDLDGDGAHELAIATQGADGDALSGGQVHLLPGGLPPGAGLIQDLDSRIYTTEINAQLGVAVAPVDAGLAVGAHMVDEERGAVYLFDQLPLGPTPVEDADAVIRGVSGLHTGRSLASGDFIGGDGLDDLVVGAPTARTHDHLHAGAAFFFEGPIEGELQARSPVGTAPDVAWELYGRDPEDRAGRLVEAVGDLDGDGLEDLVISVPGDGEHGALGVHLGLPFILDRWSSSVADGLRVIEGVSEAPLLRPVVQGADLDGDGQADLVVGMAEGEAQGVAVWFGPIQPATYLLPEADEVVLSPQEGAGLGRHLAAGDVDGDGRAELLVGAPAWDLPGEPDVGSVLLLEGW